MEHVSAQDHAAIYSPYLAGSLGLNIVPNARMDEVGTVRLGIQIADPLNVTIRQTAEISGITDDPIQLYPGIDLKLRLLTETRSRPEVSVGLQSAIGHKRQAGEILYRPFNKRYAIGAEAWQAFKRDPNSSFNLALNGDHILSGHVNG